MSAHYRFDPDSERQGHVGIQPLRRPDAANKLFSKTPAFTKKLPVLCGSDTPQQHDGVAAIIKEPSS